MTCGNLIGYCLGWFLAVWLFGVNSVQYLVHFWLHKDIGFIPSFIIAIFTMQFVVPAAIVTWILNILEIL